MMSRTVFRVPFVLLLLAIPACTTEVMLVAHRGASHDAPENTLASVNLAWERDADAVEIDVRLSRDGRIVVYHDEDTERIGGRAKKVAEQTLDELRDLDVGSYKGGAWAGERIPTLEEVLATVPEGKVLFVEVKCGLEIRPKLNAVLDECPLPARQVVVIGFDLETIEAVKKDRPGHKVYWLVDMERDQETGQWTPTVAEMLEKAISAGVDGLNVNACEAVDGAFVRKIRAAGMALYVWTVNDPLEAVRLGKAGVEGITTDRPSWLKQRM